MKRLKVIGNIFVAIMLLIATTGMTMHKHYCLGQLKSIEINHKAESCADIMGLEDEADCSMHCCKEESSQLKINDIDYTQVVLDLSPSLFLLSWTDFFEFDTFFFEQIATSFPRYSKPPLPPSEYTTLYQVFLI